MKKFLAIFLVLTLLFSFAACDKDGKGDESSTTPTDQSSGTDTTNPTEKPTAPPFDNPNLTVPETLFGVIGADNYNMKSRKPNTSASKGETTIAKRYDIKQKKPAVIVDKLVSGSTEIILNQTTLKDMISKGWKFAGNIDKNQAVKPGKAVVAFLTNEQNKILNFDVVNNTENIVGLTDCVITGVSVFKSLEINYEWADITIGDKVNTESSYADVAAGFGIPMAINVNEFYQKNDYVKCNASLLYECKLGNTSYNVSITYIDENGKSSIDSFVVLAL